LRRGDLSIENKWLKRNNKGSITVEAALVMPLFIYGIVAFMYFLHILYIQECIQAGITEVAKEASRYGYLYEELLHSEQSADEAKETDTQSICKSIIDGSFFKVRLNEYLTNCNMSDTCIVGGKTGIVMLLSSFMEDEETVEVVAAYHIKIPVVFFRIKGFTMVQRVRTRAFIGQDNSDKGGSDSGEEADNTQIVYITETGTVYHYNRACTHLLLSIHTATAGQLELFRNDNGGKYKPCEKCSTGIKLKEDQTVYITNEGNRYHTTLDCTGLKRTIIEVHLSEVKDRNACKRCR
jgi:hypothetical protein